MYRESQITHFEFEEHPAILVRPEGKPNGRLLWKCEYFDAFPNFEEAMVGIGYTLCFLSHPNRWADMNELAVISRFLKKVADDNGLDPRVVTSGMSCGGLFATKFAEYYPEQVGVLYLDAPVLNILSMAGLGEHHESMEFWQEIANTYGVSRSTILNFRESPIDKMEPLIAHNIPVLLMYGNADTTVVYTENGKVLEDYYRKHGGTIKVISRSMCGHHPHGAEDPTKMIEFVERVFPK